MVREDEVHPAGVDVEPVAEVGGAHGGALDVPAGPPPTPGAVPAPLLGRDPLPQGEIERILLGLVARDPRPGSELVDPATGELAVAGEAPHRVVHVPGPARHLEDIAPTGRDQGLDQRDHLREVLAHARLPVGREAADRRHPLAVDRLHAAREVERRLAVLAGTRQDLVVDVGHVAHVGDLEPSRAEMSDQNVERHRRASVTGVRDVVHGRSTAVDAGLSRLTADELLGLAREGVVELEGASGRHGPTLSQAPRAHRPRTHPTGDGMTGRAAPAQARQPARDRAAERTGQRWNRSQGSSGPRYGFGGLRAAPARGGGRQPSQGSTSRHARPAMQIRIASSPAANPPRCAK